MGDVDTVDRILRYIYIYTFYMYILQCTVQLMYKFGRRDKGKQKKENEWIYDTLIVQQMMYLQKKIADTHFKQNL